MSDYTIPYGKTQLSFHLPDNLSVEVVEPHAIPPAPVPLEVVRQAIAAPLGETRLEELVSPGTASVGIAINDKTRPVPHHHILPPLLDKLASLGIPDQVITFFVATGTHPPMPDSEFGLLLPPEILAHYTVICHNAKDDSSLEYLGDTPRGTPVFVNRLYHACDLRIVIGNVEPHQFQGFSGGAKSAAIGLAGQATVNRNHAWMSDPHARLGVYELNPARQDIEDIGDLIGIHFAVNAVLNDHKQIVGAFAGTPRAVMAAGIPLARQVCQVAVSAPFNMTIASPGGHPKDINIYQAQKGLYHACLVTRLGSPLILAAACPEGAGSQSYENWMKGKTSFEQVFETFKQEGFRVGPHKAFQIARDASSVQLQFISEMPPDFARSLLLNPVPDLQTAIDSALAALPPGARVGILPRASSTIPNLAP